MKKLIQTSLLCSLIFISCGPADHGAFVTKLGKDTLAVETFEMTQDGINAKVVLRSPRTVLSSYQLTLDESGGIQKMITYRHNPEEGFDSEGVLYQLIEQDGDSLKIQIETSNGLRTFMTPYEEGTLPFIDMVHWPYELALKQAYKAGQDTVIQPLLSGRSISDFVIAKIDTDSMTIRHPFRGVMGVDVSKNGHLMMLDAGLTTRKLKVYRHQDVDIDAIGKHFAARPEFGELSGAAEKEYQVHGETFYLTYGTPRKRGRTIFGGIVPWGERWRTGANRATHFTTSADLRFGDLEVPAGEYTLFTIPEEDGGTLIINRQTGQNGNSYNEEMDLGRVPMTISTQDEVTEVFTITVEEEGDGGVLKLIWDQTVFSIPFEIQ